MGMVHRLHSRVVRTLTYAVSGEPDPRSTSSSVDAVCRVLYITTIGSIIMSTQEREGPKSNIEPNRIKYVEAKPGVMVLYDIENGDSWMESDVSVKDLLGDGR